ncbi:glycerophosphodiester phosphodiesterase family protein [Flavobacterium sp. UMI-01]|uniref:glycerophosphodiester phosphodiesterase family protein n=1 Tax=Flavobacterium sp. UMI-01 TaxID=1441053 RepID=UPI001C7D9F55|nr:glycerophosphodiester phosphodiesterase family protein [Flavobacterium sp. UMI-01]GIZ07562.1 glycerophosphoryl diester phosphodiesterase [Flavobacterium sp. UMI-01]
MKIHKILIGTAIITMTSCKSPNTISEPRAHHIQVQGHRGERGNLPENTIEAFLGAIHKGVAVIELDVVISKDRKVVVSHEPYMSSLYMSTPSGQAISKSQEKEFNLYQMDYQSIKEFDSGSRGNENFPNQKKIKTYKPLLSEVFDKVEQELEAKKLPLVKYNIEIKSVKAEYGISQPQPEDFIALVMEVIKMKKMQNRINIQSFDPSILTILHQKHPEIEIAYLVSKGSIQENLKLLNFKPQIYSPHFALIQNKATVDSVKGLQMKLIPWTVNEPKDISRMIQLQVDGIITDYPERIVPNASKK